MALPGGETLTLTARPLGLPTSAPLTFQATCSPVACAVEAIEIRGVNMDMGRTRLPADPQGTARGYLPVCTRRAMHWRLDVVATIGGAPVVAQFSAWTGEREDGG